MPLAVYFPLRGMSTSNYDEVLQRLHLAGQWSPTGRVYHVSFGKLDDLQVFEVWDLRENFQAFSETLRPILAEMGIDLEEPELHDVHNVMIGWP